ncbi:3-dehydroquinate synthase [Campylobacter hyointestinalis]|uniref:3-dehydroquinate synthase n=1 Tax=Campylobacter hyointestinalis TaxID=198 RepID=UPI0007C8B497|nr:3-dehydroquinate synthase [Campylobacter hyointestinalis]ANE34259.1 3-dehydroquinate synthase [Campylobacter hyointestinalis subsp. lawsonii CCUG 27631]RAZ24127.1 3-dehydroquinate synthase [Campylobacter hyointestinalis subsp. lawsonii]RAZ38737.1 3-dehydroquinate synthase [Campylobacter hyointestinalis subsp. lawsonii]RAZ48346.1 3-dehydroquinate synthase [Campylobacter hyointestinalis subsp. lawsonii]
MQINIDLKENSYPVFIDELKALNIGGKVAIITNSKVGGLYVKDILNLIKADEIFVVTLPDGEQYKNLSSIEQILEQLFISKLERSSTLIALGGGVISDMTGFVASIYERGIKFINIPTTLLAQVDASVGGKTGINNKFGKNLIGTFYQPRAVYCETKFLKSLPSREFSAGVAEAIKMAVMFDKDLFYFMQNSDLNDDEILKNVIAKCVSLKAAVVAKDEKEGGIRAVLNYGHTFAHVIEMQTNYTGFLHGEAVAIGINMANHLALKLGLISKDELEMVKNLLCKFRLPVTYEIKDEFEFYNAFFLDKKSQNSKIKFILPKGIGDFCMKNDISKEIVLDTLREFK